MRLEKKAKELNATKSQHIAQLGSIQFHSTKLNMLSQDQQSSTLTKSFTSRWNSKMITIQSQFTMQPFIVLLWRILTESFKSHSSIFKRKQTSETQTHRKNRLEQHRWIKNYISMQSIRIQSQILFANSTTTAMSCHCNLFTFSHWEMPSSKF